MADDYKNIGQLVGGPIRVNDSRDTYPSAYSNELLGGLHSVSTISDRDSIFLQRRSWGMLCYVIENKTTYQLTYNDENSNLNDNSNWLVYSDNNTGGSSYIVKAIRYSKPVQADGVIIGDKFLINTNDNDSSAITWKDDSNNTIKAGTIAICRDINESGICTFNYIEPINGETVRVIDYQEKTSTKEPYSLYKYIGDYDNDGKWIKERTNQILFLDFSFYRSTDTEYIYNANINPFYEITDKLYVLSFNITNDLDKPVYLIINGDITKKYKLNYFNYNSNVNTDIVKNSLNINKKYISQLSFKSSYIFTILNIRDKYCIDSITNDNATISFNVSTNDYTITIKHYLGSKDVNVQLWEKDNDTNNYYYILTQISIVDENTVNIIMNYENAPANFFNNFKVVINS